jgi:hypothetical protein
LINSLGWTIYLLPFAVLAILVLVCVDGYHKLKSKIFDSITSQKAVLMFTKGQPNISYEGYSMWGF